MGAYSNKYGEQVEEKRFTVTCPWAAERLLAGTAQSSSLSASSHQGEMSKVCLKQWYNWELTNHISFASFLQCQMMVAFRMRTASKPLEKNILVTK